MTESDRNNRLPTKWIVGLDLRPSSQGAIHFAKWMHAASAGSLTMVGVHVLEEAHLQAALRYHHLSELEKTAREAAWMVIGSAGADEALADRHVVQGVQAEQTLEAARQYHRAGGIVVGRQALREGARLLRLGRVARRLLRTLPSPIVVVPPDHDDTAAGFGPVILTTNLQDDSTTAAKFAAAFAQTVGRDLVVVHVVPHADDYGAHYIPEESRRSIEREHEDHARRQIRAWLTGLGLHPKETLVVPGHVTESIRDLARERDAALVVCGSRRMTTMERILLTSIGSELAAAAPCPVAVVPPILPDILP